MKKRYIQPQAKAYELAPAQLIAASQMETVTEQKGLDNGLSGENDADVDWDDSDYWGY